MIQVGQRVKVLDAPMGVPDYVIGQIYEVAHVDGGDNLPIGLKIPHASGHLNCWWFKKTHLKPMNPTEYLTNNDKLRLLEAAAFIKGVTSATHSESDFADIIELLERLGRD